MSIKNKKIKAKRVNTSCFNDKFKNTINSIKNLTSPF